MAAVDHKADVSAVSATARAPRALAAGLAPAGPDALVGTQAIVRTAAGAVLATLVIAALYFGREIIMPLALAVLLGFVLSPAVTRLRRWGMPRVLAVVTVVLLALAVIGASAAFMAREFQLLSAQLPTYQNTIKSKLERLRDSVEAPGMFEGLRKTLSLVQRETSSIAAPQQAQEASTQIVEIRDGSDTPVQRALSWLERIADPLIMAGIVLVFVVMILLDRLDLRDRLIRLMGGSLHRATDAMDEAGERISRYLIMQLWVNLSYGLPMALGLWMIGVPGAFLWGMLAAVMRYLPYVGPLISAVFPLTLAFAVDPGWDLLLWTLGLILVLELISNNIVEPWLYGSSTGLSAISLIVAATFWTALWGPVGLVMSTPLTVCMLVIGRYLPALQFLDVLLGSQPTLDAPTRLYQRLLAGDEDEAVELGRELADQAQSVSTFYDNIAIPVLRGAVTDYQTVATSEHRLRVVTGMEALLDDLDEEYPVDAIIGRETVTCIGGKWEVDSLAARMLVHALGQDGVAAQLDPRLANSSDALRQLDLRTTRTVCISLFSPEPEGPARRICRGLRRRWPGVRIVLCFWSREHVDEGAAHQLGADAVATSLIEAVLQAKELLDQVPQEWQKADIPDGDAARLRLLQDSGVLDDPELAQQFEQAAKRAAAIFDVPAAMVSIIDEHQQRVRGHHGELRTTIDGKTQLINRADQLELPREHSLCGHVVAESDALVVPDLLRDPRFAGNPHLRSRGLRFYAGAPLRIRRGGTIGSLCLLDTEPRQLTERDTRLLQAMADDLVLAIGERSGKDEVTPADAPPTPPPPASATVGQVLPGP